MQVHALHRHVVDSGFGLGQTRKELVRPGLSGLAQRRAFDRGPDVLQVVVPVGRRTAGVRRQVRRWRLVHPELDRRDAALDDTVGADGVPLHRKAAESLLQSLERHAGIQQRAQNHVAGRTGKAVEVQRFHRRHAPNTSAYSKTRSHSSPQAAQGTLARQRANTPGTASRTLCQQPSPKTMWSTTAMPMRSPAWTSRRVSAMSSALGVGSPDGWL